MAEAAQTATQRFDVVSIGGATQDVFVQSEDSKVIEMREKGKNSSYLAFPYGSKVDVQHVLFMTGGGATNVAVALAKQSLRISCVASVGVDDAAKSIETRLQRDGVDTSLMLRDSEHGTAYSVILTSFEGDRTVLVYRGAGENISFSSLPIDKMFQTEWIYVSNLGKSSDTVYPPLFEEAKKHNVKIAFNPGVATIKKGLEFNKEILSKVDVLLLNREECLCLLGKPEDTRYDYVREELLYKKMLLTLTKAGVKIPVITDSFRGVHASADGFYYFCPAFKVKAVSTLGAGDAFGATFIAGLMRTKGDVGQSLIEASANAANVIQGFGAKKRLLSKEGIDKYIAEAEEKINFLRRPIAEVGTNLVAGGCQ